MHRKIKTKKCEVDLSLPNTTLTLKFLNLSSYHFCLMSLTQYNLRVHKWKQEFFVLTLVIFVFVLLYVCMM